MSSTVRPSYPGLAADPRESALSWSRRRWLQSTSAASALALVPSLRAQTVSAAAEEAQAPAMPAVGSVLHLPRITLLDGRVMDPADTAGKPLLVYWWSSTCPFCAQQSPSMNLFWLAQKARGLQMVALSIDKKPEDAQAYLARKGYQFPAAWASPDWRKSFPKPKGLPITLLRGRDGRLLLAERGQMFAEDVEAMGQLL